MLQKVLKGFNILTIVAISTIVAYFMFIISGRSVIADFIRPFFISIAMWGAIYLLIKSKYKKLAYISSACLAFFYTIITAFFLYYNSIGEFFTFYDIIAIEQSSFDEIYSFIDKNILTFENFSNFAIYIIACSFITLLITKNTFIPRKKSKFKACVALLLIIGASLFTTTLRPIKYYSFIGDDLEQTIQVFKSNPKKTIHNYVHKEKQGELYVLVIGESASKDAMGVYSNILNNTPFLSQITKDKKDNTVLFNNAYASFINTVPSITASFSQGNLATGMTYPKGENLINLAKQAKFKTYWLSNQDKDNHLSGLASFADYSYFSSDDDNNTDTKIYDDILLDKLSALSEDLDSSKNNLIIVHLMGSQTPYRNRYPSDFEVFNVMQSKQLGSLAYSDLVLAVLRKGSEVDSYLTSIKYTDSILEKIYNIFSKRDDYYGLVYYADHADAIIYSSYREDKVLPRHNVTNFKYDMTRIPFIVNVSDNYKYDYLKSFTNMQKNKDHIVTNDTLYDFMLSFMQVESNFINKSLSVTSDKYLINEKNAKLFNDFYIKNDPQYIEIQHAKQLKNIIINNVQTMFMANSTASLGFNKLHLKVFLKDKNIFINAIENGDQNDIYSLDEYMQNLYTKDIQVFLEFNEQTKLNDIQEALNNKRYANKIYIIHSNDVESNSDKLIYNLYYDNHLRAVKASNIEVSKELFDLMSDEEIASFKHVYVVLNDIYVDNIKLNSLITRKFDNVSYMINIKSAFN